MRIKEGIGGRGIRGGARGEDEGGKTRRWDGGGGAKEAEEIWRL
jgi:hypothetical protein